MNEPESASDYGPAMFALIEVLEAARIVDRDVWVVINGARKDSRAQLAMGRLQGALARFDNIIEGLGG